MLRKLGFAALALPVVLTVCVAVVLNVVNVGEVARPYYSAVSAVIPLLMLASIAASTPIRRRLARMQHVLRFAAAFNVVGSMVIAAFGEGAALVALAFDDRTDATF